MYMYLCMRKPCEVYSSVTTAPYTPERSWVEATAERVDGGRSGVKKIFSHPGIAAVPIFVLFLPVTLPWTGGIEPLYSCLALSRFRCLFHADPLVKSRVIHGR